MKKFRYFIFNENLAQIISLIFFLAKIELKNFHGFLLEENWARKISLIFVLIKIELTNLPWFSFWCNLSWIFLPDFCFEETDFLSTDRNIFSLHIDRVSRILNYCMCARHFPFSTYNFLPLLIFSFRWYFTIETEAFRQCSCVHFYFKFYFSTSCSLKSNIIFKKIFFTFFVTSFYGKKIYLSSFSSTNFTIGWNWCSCDGHYY